MVAEFLSVSKCSHRKPTLINLFIAFSLDLLELYCQEFVYAILFIDKNYSNGHLFITSRGFSKIQFTVLIMFSFTC